MLLMQMPWQLGVVGSLLGIKLLKKKLWNFKTDQAVQAE
jgi:hypothetical protein